MPHPTNWIALADAVARLDPTDDASPAETLRRLCYDGRVRSRGMVGRAVVALGADWWSAAVEIDTASGRIVKGPLTRSLPTRALTEPGDRLGPGDWQEARIPGNLAENVEIWRAELDAVLTGASAEDATGPSTGPSTEGAPPEPKEEPVAEPQVEPEPEPQEEPAAEPRQEAEPPSDSPRPAPVGYSPARLESWYADWVAVNEQSGHAPSRVEDWTAAREALGDAVPREAVRALRRKPARGPRPGSRTARVRTRARTAGRRGRRPGDGGAVRRPRHRGRHAGTAA